MTDVWFAVIETDVAVAHDYDISPQPLDPGFERRELLLDPVLIAVHRDHPLAGTPSLGAFAAERWKTLE